MGILHCKAVLSAWKREKDRGKERELYSRRTGSCIHQVTENENSSFPPQIISISSIPAKSLSFGLLEDFNFLFKSKLGDNDSHRGKNSLNLILNSSLCQSLWRLGPPPQAPVGTASPSSRSPGGALISWQFCKGVTCYHRLP